MKRKGAGHVLRETRGMSTKEELTYYAAIDMASRRAVMMSGETSSVS